LGSPLPGPGSRTASRQNAEKRKTRRNPAIASATVLGSLERNHQTAAAMLQEIMPPKSFSFCLIIGSLLGICIPLSENRYSACQSDFALLHIGTYFFLDVTNAASGTETTTRVKRVNAVIAITRLISINPPCMVQSLVEELRFMLAERVQMPVTVSELPLARNVPTLSGCFSGRWLGGTRARWSEKAPEMFRKQSPSVCRHFTDSYCKEEIRNGNQPISGSTGVRNSSNHAGKRVDVDGEKVGSGPDADGERPRPAGGAGE
jgi:hypothetical protein